MDRIGTRVHVLSFCLDDPKQGSVIEFPIFVVSAGGECECGHERDNHAGIDDPQAPGCQSCTCRAYRPTESEE